MSISGVTIATPDLTFINELKALVPSVTESMALYLPGLA